MSKIIILNLFVVYYIFCFLTNFISCFIDNQPKIISEDGHLIFQPAKDRNITFQLNGRSKLMVDNVNLLSVVKEAKLRFDAISHEEDTSLRQQCTTLINEVSGPNGIIKRMNHIENITQFQLTSNSTWVRRTKNRIAELRSTVYTLKEKLLENNCLEEPCQNGGTCIDLFDNFLCNCAEGWKGKTCQSDVNECAYFAGTDLGCQNNAQCINTPGSYQCVCSIGWVGLHCTLRKVDCYSAPPGELCGHGTCVPANNEHGYTCICNQGWKSNYQTPSCTMDIDECAESHAACFSSCINLPGSFTCSPCPAGYTGNGFRCHDLNECAVDNGGCSTSPRVLCINTEGSYHCGSCPIGWSGDGKMCSRLSSDQCLTNNICHPLATCQYISNRMVCICPEGMFGDGFGPSGCNRNSRDPCIPNRCNNGGTCIRVGANNYSCNCLDGYEQPNCDDNTDPCRNNPCLNGGTCIRSNKTASLFECQCHPDFEGTLCNTNSRGCGGLLAESSGVLKYPFEGKYESHKSCAWVIKTTVDKVINVTFLKFDLEKSEDCKRDWVQIHDGRSSSGYLFGRFCGTDLPNGGSIVSFHNKIYLWFRSDSGNQHDGFQLSWTSAEPSCGGYLNDVQGTISSPAFPRNSPPNRACEWSIVSPYGQVVRLVFYQIQFAGSTNSCTTDYLAVHDGGSVEGPLVEKFCNTSVLPAPVQTSSDNVIIHFESGPSGHNLFQLHYSFVSGIPECGGHFTMYRGEFGSPSFEGRYHNNLLCDYLIKLPPGTKINLHFTKFELEYEEDCYYDSLEIFDGKTADAPLVGRWCGEDTPPDYESSSNYLLIKFTTDLSSPHAGFRVNYKLGCGDVYRNSTGIITSPLYPHKYLPNLECLYIIEAPIHKAVKLEFKDFDVMSFFSEYYSSYYNVTGVCEDDYLEVYDGWKAEKNLLGRFCSDKPPPPTELTTTNRVYLLFKTNEYDELKGFKIEYSFIDIECGGVLKELNHTILYNPEEKGVSKECVWHIIGKEDANIFLKFNQIDLDAQNGCPNEYLEISAENLMEKNETNRICGRTLPPEMFYTKSKVTIKFSTKSLIGNGFEFTYQAFPPGSVCEANYSAPFGSITSPGWPSEYSDYANCLWILSAPIGHQIELNVKSFSLEHTDNCRLDYLEIRNGMTEDAPLIGRYCGDEIPSRIPSFTNHLYIKFISDSSITYSGFEIDWRQTASGCGGILESHEGSIQSPHYPDIVDDVAQCDWRIVINKGSIIRIGIKNLESDLSKDCHRNYLTIFDGLHSSSRKIPQTCSDDNPLETTLETTGNEALIRFVSNADGITRKFYLSYITICSRELHDLYGVIESPNFPNTYPRSLYCEWKIIGRKNNRIAIEFSHFDLEGSYDEICHYDYVTIEDSKNNKTLKTNTYCLTKPPPFISEGEMVTIRFGTDFSKVFTGFRLEYKIDGCGGILNSKFGEIRAPDYPSGVDIYCEWIIQTDFGSTIQLVINEFEIDTNIKNCSANGLYVANGRDISQIITEICSGEVSGQVLNSAGHEMYIRFYTDSIRTRKLFVASYKIKESQCGGLMKSLSGNIYSPHFPDNYFGNSYCEWLIQTDEYHTLDLTVMSFDMEASPDCKNDYLEIYNGNFKSSNKLLLRHCGSELPVPNKFFSTESTFAVVMGTNNQTEKHGFQLSFKRNCGKSIETSSPGWLIKDLNDDNCIWTIRSKDIYQHIQLTFKHVQGDCNDDTTNSKGTFVYDGDSIESPLKTKFCSEHPPDIISNGNALTIDAKNGYFQAFYSIYDNTCGGTLTSLRGRFATPLYPNSYPVNVECIWQISFRDGNFIELQFENMDIPMSDHCNEDYLEIRERSASGTLLGIFCSSEIPPKLRAFQNMWIKFRSNNDRVGNGFIATYSYAHENEINGTQGKIRPPPIERAHEESTDFSWRLAVERGNVISLVIKQYSQGLKMFDGFDETAVEIDITDKSTITSNTNAMYILGDHMLLKNFLLEWRTVPKTALAANTSHSSCGDEIMILPNRDYVNLKSPGYPYGYASALVCEWIIKTNETGAHVGFRPLIVDLESLYECSADSLSIYSSQDMNTWNLVKTMCDFNSDRDNNRDIIHGNPFLKIKFSTDYSVNATGFTGRLYTICGGEISSSAGSIHGEQFLGYPQSNCTWKIEVRRGKQIQFEFIKHLNSMDSHGNCLNYITIANGIDEFSPILDKYCSDHNDNIPLTTSHRAFVIFNNTRRMSDSDYDWILNFREVSDVCEDNLMLTHYENESIITTPNYPLNPNSYTECIWTVIAPVGESINLTFIERFDLSQKSGCQDEYVEIRDGSTSISPLLGIYCNDPGQIHSNGNTLRMKYVTNLAEPRSGFKAKFTLAKCGSTSSDYRGQIKSFHYPTPGAYPSGSICDYRIQIGRLFRVNITFDDIHLPPPTNDNNQTDFIIIYDVYKDNEKDIQHEISRIYGNNTLKSILSSSNNVLIEFHTFKSTLIYRGFKMSYRQVYGRCDSVERSESGILKTPHYPNRVHTFSLCKWRIEVPKGRRIKLEMIDYLIDSEHMNTTQPSKVQFYNDLNMRNLITEITNTAPKYIYSTDKIMIIRSVIKPNSNLIGFQIKYTSDELTICPGTLDETVGEITSIQEKVDNTNSGNMMNYYCEYERQLNGNETLALKIRVENLSIPNRCVTLSPIIIIVKQWAKHRIVCEAANELIALPFTSNKLQTSRSLNTINSSFVIQYKTHSCGGVAIFSTDLNITKPEFIPSYGEVTCAWYISSRSYLNKFNITGNFSFKLTCDEEYIDVFNGIFYSSPKIGRFCGNNTQMPQFKPRRDILIVYHTEKQSQSEFTIGTVEPNQCGGEITDGYIHFPSSLYKNNIECIWDIRTPTGTHVGIEFIGRFFIEDSFKCQKDYLDIRDLRNNEWQSIGRVCGRQYPPTFNSTSNRMQLIFRTDSENVGDGFFIRIYENCGGVYEVTDTKNILTSQNWPDSYPSMATCNYTFITNSTKLIYIHFKEFELEDTIDCRSDNLTVFIYNRWSNEAILKGTYCKRNSIEEIRTIEKVILIFRSNIYVEGKGFELEYHLDNCGGLITENTIIRSPIDDETETYYNDLNCLWNITAPTGKTILITFRYFDLELDSNCQSDYVEIVGDQRNVLCGNLTNLYPHYIIHHNNATFTFRTDYSLTRKGFEAVIDILDKCGGKYHLDETKSNYNLDYYDQRSTNKLDCHYVFDVADGYVMKIIFHQFNIPLCRENGTDACTCNYIEIHDGISSMDSERFCGENFPRTYMTSKNTLFIRYIMNSNLPQTGINATVSLAKSQCGPTAIELSTSGTVIELSNDDNSSYPANYLCFWTLTGSSAIKLHFDFMDIEESSLNGVCHDYLEISGEEPEDEVYYDYPDEDVSEIINEYNVRENGKKIFCGNMRPADYISNSKKLNLKFLSNGEIGGKGFRLTAQYGKYCKNHTGLSGRIQDDGNECEMFITAPANHTIALHFYDLGYFYSDCSTDYFKIYDVIANSTLGTICKNTGERHIFSNSSQIRLDIHATVNYDITYFASSAGQGCGGKIFSQSGMLSSPLYPYSERNYSNCRWDIHVPRNYKVELTFDEFDMGAKILCKDDHVQIVDISSTGTEEKARQFCGGDSPAPYKSKWNVVAIVYQRTVHFDGTGWVLNFKAVPAKD